eukprot:RCo054393
MVFSRNRMGDLPSLDDPDSCVAVNPSDESTPNLLSSLWDVDNGKDSLTDPLVRSPCADLSRDALLEFASTLSVCDLSSWIVPDSTPCSWEGVSCDADLLVAGLDLSGQNCFG